MIINKGELKGTLDLADRIIKSLQEAKKDLQGDSVEDALLAHSFITSIKISIKASGSLISLGLRTGASLMDESFPVEDEDHQKWREDKKSAHPLFLDEDKKEKRKKEMLSEILKSIFE